MSAIDPAIMEAVRLALWETSSHWPTPLGPEECEHLTLGLADVVKTAREEGYEQAKAEARIAAEAADAEVARLRAALGDEVGLRSRVEDAATRLEQQDFHYGALVIRAALAATEEQP